MFLLGATHSFLNFCISSVLELNPEVQRGILEAFMRPVRQPMAQLGGSEWAGIIGSGSSGLTKRPSRIRIGTDGVHQSGRAVLMILAQHFEPFVLQENNELSRSLSEQIFPYGQQKQQSGLQGKINPPDNAADFLLSCLAKATANCLSEAIPGLKVSVLNQLNIWPPI